MIVFIVIKERDETKSKINDELIKLLELKVSVNKEINIKKNITEKEKIIKPNLDYFNINKVFLSSLLKSLWNYPEAMYHILLNYKLQIYKYI